MNGWFKIYNDIVDNGTLAKMSASSLKVFVVLCRRADKNGSCFPSASLLADQTGMSKRHVLRCVSELESLSLIVCQKKNGTQTVFTLTTGDKISTGTGDICDKTGDTGVMGTGDICDTGPVTFETCREEDSINKTQLTRLKAPLDLNGKNLDIDLPDFFQSKEFCDLYLKWSESRIHQFGPFGLFAHQEIISKLAQWGLALAIAGIRAAIESGHKTIYKPRDVEIPETDGKNYINLNERYADVIRDSKRNGHSNKKAEEIIESRPF